MTNADRGESAKVQAVLSQKPLHFCTLSTLGDRATIERLHANCALYATKEQTAADVLRLASDDERLLVAWALAGQGSGHEWCACGACGELRLMKPPTPKGEKERCVMTYHCDGEMERLAKRPLTTKRVKESLRVSERCPYCDRVMSIREAVEQGACNDCYGGAYDPAS